MVKIIENEALKLVEHFKIMFQNGYNYEIANARKTTTINNNNNIGQIYKLQKDPKSKLNKLKLYNEFDVDKNKISNRKPRTVADLYMKAEDYAEVRKVSQSAGMVIPMHDAFGVTVLNTLWMMMAGKRSASITPIVSILSQMSIESVKNM